MISEPVLLTLFCEHAFEALFEILRKDHAG
jgi:hypothetical protein